MFERALSALAAIPADCPGDTWLRAGMAAKAAGIPFHEFDSWSSRGGDRYRGKQDTLSRWNSFKRDGGITSATLFHLARAHGWDEGNKSAVSTPSPKALSIWETGEPATTEHPYILRKGGSPTGLRVYRGPLRIAKEAVDGWLMIPAYSGSSLQSLQFISPASGKKLNLPGASLAGAYHVVGNLSRESVAYIAEGIGAAWTIHHATGAAAIVTFGSGNTSRITEALGKSVGRLVLVADRGKEAAREADAARAGCAWVEMPSDLPEGDDINDLAARDGLQAVCEILRSEHQSVGASAPCGFEFSRVGDMLSGGLKPISWLVRNYVETDSLALMFGDPASGKSFAAIDLACCVSTGKDWHGNAVTPGAAFYIVGEGHNGLMRRFAAWERYNETSLSRAPLFISHHSARLYDDEAAAEVARAVNALSENSGATPSLIVIDTLARNFGGADENSAQDMGSFISNVDEHLRSRFKACVLIVHHSGHSDKSRARGSTALKGALDAEYAVAKDETGIMRVEATKMKDAEPPAPLAFRLERIELPLKDEASEQLSSCALVSVDYAAPPKMGKTGRGRNQTLALQVLADLFTEHRDRLSRAGLTSVARVTLDEWRARLKEKGLSKYAIRDLTASLKEAGKIVDELGGYVRLVGQSF